MSMRTPVQDRPPFTGHSPDQHRPLGAYGALTATFASAAVGFACWFRASGRELPERIDHHDVALISIATHKASRLIAKDRVTSTARAPFTRFQDDAGPAEVSEEARGSGLRRAIGELVICPYCLAPWIASSFVGGLLVAPRTTRCITTVLCATFASDVLQIAYSKAESTL
jgi:Protein of unknown function (DUF1360)